MKRPVFEWDRGDRRFKMYYYGRWKRDGEDGLVGDVKARPVSMGEGPFTITLNPADCYGLPEEDS